MLKRILYLGYYLKKLDTKKFRLFFNYVKNKTGKSSLIIYSELIRDSLIYNVSILEYFQFRYFEKNPEEKNKWAGTGFMYEFQKVMNPTSKRNILDDKTLFYKKYKSYFKHHVLDIDAMKSNISTVEEMLKMDKVVLKESRGKCGLGTVFIDSKNYTPDTLIEYMQNEGFDLAETYIVQHVDLNKLSPSGVNTVRIFTQLNDINEVEILGCRQRISVNSPVDNMAAGNLAAFINEKTGIIEGPGVYSDITKFPEEIHPITGIPIVGFQVPFWNECLQLVKDAALEHPQNRSIGWDIVVTPNGPGLIEGNHDWCKLVLQLPVDRGMKPTLEKHLNAYKNR